MVPNKIEDEESQVARSFGIFGATLISFFLVEMGDKIQLAAVAMAARYMRPLLLVVGTTAGMFLADVPAVFLGDKRASKIPMKLVHSIAAAIFLMLGIATLVGASARLGV
jgi:putative Ca2+/H+ antiporter (TMEM165/GDT1 family)